MNRTSIVTKLHSNFKRSVFLNSHQDTVTTWSSHEIERTPWRSGGAYMVLRQKWARRQTCRSFSYISLCAWYLCFCSKSHAQKLELCLHQRITSIDEKSKSTVFANDILSKNKITVPGQNTRRATVTLPRLESSIRFFSKTVILRSIEGKPLAR